MCDQATENNARNSGNARLHQAHEARADEFYTQLVDIEQELRHYRNEFRDKIVFCNCDDPYESNFFKYFAMNFNVLGLKKLICTCYDSSPFAGGELDLFSLLETPPEKKAYKVEITSVEDLNGDGAIDINDVDLLVRTPGVVTLLQGNGDFRSDECIELLKESDIVVTNPPFSLFREYVAQLVKYNKKCLIIGNQNALTYKEIFPLIKDNKMWLGCSIHNGDREFRVPSSYNRSANYRIDENGNKFVRVRGPRWFTNLDYRERHDPLTLYKHYSPAEYPKYDNYDAINVDKTAEIPMDYDGVMGVPITFMDKYCPEQFEIVGADCCDDTPPIKTYSHKDKIVDGVKHKSQTGTLGCTIREKSFGPGTYFDVGYPVKAIYKRIFIKRK